jgi:hypothetical protein
MLEVKAIGDLVNLFKYLDIFNPAAVFYSIGRGEKILEKDNRLQVKGGVAQKIQRFLSADIERDNIERTLSIDMGFSSPAAAS